MSLKGKIKPFITSLKQVDGTVDARVDAKISYKFSPSSLSLLKDCPRCFWLNFNKGIKRPDTIFPSLPSGMDKVLKEYLFTTRFIYELG